ncbi:tRNA adenosine(34) deaminase TadA [Shewanella sp. Choline-02u-19]|uniref:tRNA adenosine(34) deaminase TadA n=1 Tax=unclassified Shewanella TaxID=196818 RepID=UPI000C34457A|nr:MULTISPECIES: tRNA adenosine(34) deaminase TadA [unclassified Shewanella]PKG56448.1 tRNA adenosine(34) deaminase TadA [Shewanella sp. GutDb-MelDb]PKG74764.1 tRNA adenosine(34) deaminase TadA [Shewanella sp. GutCb]PKH54224.1 tRNA adenosine(34) deaminase TadA [Shewanella sp. Bg11-22]PKI28195.1 tRNA adenosine(34) deaminase TadA [Shewanella sp. Choline-02u-19]
MSQQEQDSRFMKMAMEMATKAEEKGEVPVGAVLVKEGEVISAGFNFSIGLHDPSAHAEMQCIRQAGKVLENYRLIDSTLYVTLEPCAMCAGAIVHSRISRLVFGANDEKTGAAGTVIDIVRHSAFNHQVEVTSGVLETECAEQLSAFFRRRRKEKKTAKALAKLDALQAIPAKLNK